MTHAIERTSPKGGDFIGRCINCGEENLRMIDALKECTNPRNMTQDQLILESITGEKHAGKSS